ncbi:chitosanase [Stigmatella sp. ncwal1]|uniref:Chitosanase n=1 Tax=Stigmatella ashevillensis TaxID=2995309 RepID=A0ABT5D4U2_9BACT|nr:chitosanase [Stigmatella ashevillena]MDC0707853.1 chitosanase [Stigmatella ashevillena]
MHERHSRRGWARCQQLALLGAAATVISCAGEVNEAGLVPETVEQALAACPHAVTTNTYVGSDWWGTLVFKNTGTSTITSPQVIFNVPSGVTCDHDEAGWTHTQSGQTCTYSSSSVTISANASYTFYYSTTSNSSFTATNVQLTSASCGGGGEDPGTGTGLTAGQKKVAEGLTSIWENDTPAIDYAYAENIDDGRGYTNGRAGFCTGTGDAIMVVECYKNLRSAANGNLLAKYMAGLTTINNRFLSTGQMQASTSELDSVGNWVSDWAASYNNTTTRADFKSCQDKINDQLYYTPAMNAAKKWGLAKALSKAALYDAFINHGEWGALQFIKAANNALGNSGQVAPAVGYNGITETAFLQKFLEKRRDTLAADSTWSGAVDRVAAYEKARRRNNLDLATAVQNDVRARDCWGTSYQASGYTVYKINPDGTWSNVTSYTYSCN